MFRDVPECSGMFHVPGFIDAPGEHVIKCHWRMDVCWNQSWNVFTKTSKWINKTSYFKELRRLILPIIQGRIIFLLIWVVSVSSCLELSSRQLRNLIICHNLCVVLFLVQYSDNQVGHSFGVGGNIFKTEISLKNGQQALKAGLQQEPITWLQANLEKSDTNSSYTRRLQWLPGVALSRRSRVNGLFILRSNLGKHFVVRLVMRL